VGIPHRRPFENERCNTSVVTDVGYYVDADRAEGGLDGMFRVDCLQKLPRAWVTRSEWLGKKPV
jgi:hypothetical protein